MKLNRSIVIPGLLFIYLCVMAALGFKDYRAGNTSPREYFGIIAVTLIVIVLLHFNIKRRDRLHTKRKEMLNCHNGQRQPGAEDKA